MNKRNNNGPRREDFVNALRDMDTFMDIAVDDLMELNSRAEKYARLRATEGGILVRVFFDRFRKPPEAGE